jgi:hypothetical protein
MRARLRRAFRGCDRVRRLASATAMGVGGRRCCRCGSAGQRGSRPHWAAPRRFLTDGRSAGRRPAHTGGGVCAPGVVLTSKPVRAGRLPAAAPPDPAPCRWTRPGPAPRRCTCGDAGLGHWPASGRARRRHLQVPARDARSRATGAKVVAGRGAGCVMPVSASHRSVDFPS